VADWLQASATNAGSTGSSLDTFTV